MTKTATAPSTAKTMHAINQKNSAINAPKIMSVFPVFAMMKFAAFIAKIMMTAKGTVTSAIRQSSSVFRLDKVNKADIAVAIIYNVTVPANANVPPILQEKTVTNARMSL